MEQEVLRSVQSELDAYLREFDDCFVSSPSRKHMATYVRGQLGPLQSKNVERIALAAGTPPRTLQQFLSAYEWSEARMRARVSELVARDEAGPAALGILDETSYSKKGEKTVGVKRQWCGETGKVDNCVVSVHLSYATETFATPVDGDLYLPSDWMEDEDRRKEAGVPEEIRFRSKWQIAIDLIDRSKANGLEYTWITADEAYGRPSGFRQGLADRGLLYVLEIPVDTMGWTPRRFERGQEHRRVDELFKRGGPTWVDYHVKDSSKGPVVWQVRSTRFVPHAGRQAEQWLLIAFNPLTGELKYFLSNAPREMPVANMLSVAFSRWRVERNFQDSKQEIGLNHFEVRTYTALQRHIALSMVSHLFLMRAQKLLRSGTDTDWPLPQTRTLANTLVDQTLLEEQREQNLLLILRNNRYYDRRAKVAAQCHAKRRKKELEEAGFDLQDILRCPAWPG